TLWRFMKKHRLSREYTTLSNHDLDHLIKAFRRDKPESGLRYLVGFPRTRGIKIQKRRVMYSLRLLNNLGRVLHRRKIIKPRVYNVRRPNTL
ncbi:hypothetical protein DFH09DRAFT_900134, partial [Mycena vulgaris]